MTVQLGESLGRYQLAERIGQGGMAVVYRATDSVLGRVVAVKVIRPAYTEDAHFLGRFLQEARLVASLDHPNILPIYDFGEHDGSPFLVIPYLPGGSLAERIEGRPQPLPRVAAWLVQLAAALDAAHARGVLHRDLKPGNVLIGNDGRLVLGDFGIARLAEQSTRLTATGMVVGTPLYMAPELCRGGDATPASDRYALGVVAYEMIAGRPPFHGMNPLSILHQQVHEPVPSLAERLPELPLAIDAWLQRVLAKDPAARPPSARAMAEELVHLLTPEQRAELSTLVWTGAGDSGGVVAPEAPTMVQRGRTLQVTPPFASRARPTGAVTAPRQEVRAARSPLVWGLVAVGLVVGAVLLVPRHLVTGEPAPGAANGPLGSTSGGAVPAGEEGVGTVADPPGSPAAEPAPPPVAGPSPAAETAATAPSGDERTATPVDGPLGVREAAQLLRRPTRRLSAADFRTLAARSEPHLSDPRLGAAMMVARDWARGGLAYAEGRDREARRVFRELESAAAAAPWGIAWPAVVFAREDWGPAVLYADPRDELAALLRPRLIGGGAPREALAAAYLTHLDGAHQQAHDQLLAAGFDPSTSGSDPGARALVAQFLAAEATEAGNAADARRWRSLAVAGGSAPLLRPFLLEMLALAAPRLTAVEVLALQDEACRYGMASLCRSTAPLAGGQTGPGGAAGKNERLLRPPPLQGRPKVRRRPPGSWQN